MQSYPKHVLSFQRVYPITHLERDWLWSKVSFQWKWQDKHETPTPSFHQILEVVLQKTVVKNGKCYGLKATIFSVCDSFRIIQSLSLWWGHKRHKKVGLSRTAEGSSVSMCLQYWFIINLQCVNNNFIHCLSVLPCFNLWYKSRKAKPKNQLQFKRHYLVIIKSLLIKTKLTLTWQSEHSMSRKLFSAPKHWEKELLKSLNHLASGVVWWLL